MGHGSRVEEERRAGTRVTASRGWGHRAVAKGSSPLLCGLGKGAPPSVVRGAPVHLACGQQGEMPLKQSQEAVLPGRGHP